MTIYIEKFLFQNVLINFCLLRLIFLTTRSKTSLFKLLFSSIIGAGFSVVSAVFLTNVYIINLLKIICAFLMILIAFKQSKKQFIFNLILLFLFTYALTGTILTLSSTYYQTSFGAIISSKFSLDLICALIIVATYIYQLIVKNIKFKIKTNNLIYSLTLTHSKNNVKINAYLDTGNFLNYEGNPVIILDLNTYLKLTNKNLIDYYLSKNENLNTKTVTGTNNLRLFKIDSVTIKNDKTKITLTNQYIAITDANIFKNTNYQALISPLFL